MENQRLYELTVNGKIKRFINNCYSPGLISKADRLWVLDESFVFSYKDNTVERLVFFSENWEKLNMLIERIDQGQYYLEFMTKDPGEFIPETATPRAAMMRLSNSDCRGVFDPDSPVIQYKDSAKVEVAAESDAEEINGILWSTFSTEVSHLLMDDALREVLGKGQTYIHRDGGGHIDALLQAEVMPKRFYINQVVNRADKHVIHALLLDHLEKYVNRGGKYLYAWAEEDNIASQKFHSKYGMKHDGMWSMIYSIKR